MTAALVLALLAAPPAAVTNAQASTRSAAAGLGAAIEQVLSASAPPQWIAWTVPIAAGQQMCCWDGSGGSGCCRGCRLEKGSGFSMQRDDDIRLEDDASGVIFVRGEKGRITRVRMFSAACPVDVGGRPLTWLTDVTPASSLAFLAGLIDRDEAGGEREVAEGALAAIAFHADPAADRLMIRLARQHPRSHVRGQALFWLSQRAGERAAASITRAIEDDPDEDVKEKAVFALSQLPKDEGVPRLIEVARTNQNREVRKKAMFWLGQSNDPRALDFIEGVLTK